MEPSPEITRRSFLGNAISLAALAGGASALNSLAADDGRPLGPSSGSWLLTDRSNGDEARYPSHIGNFSKSLPHDDLGCVTPLAYDFYLKTLSGGPSEDFERIPLSGRFRLANPQAGYALALEGYKPDDFICPPAPAFASAEQAADAAENYWQSLLRDLPFAEWNGHPLVREACEDLSRFSEFKGPKIGSSVTPATLFRGTSPGELDGPYLSQFLYLNIPFGATSVIQRYKVPLAGDDHMTAYGEWLNGQRGYFSLGASPFDPVPRFLRCGRDIGEWVRRDFSFQAYLCTALALIGDPYPKKNFRVPFSSGLPYLDSDTQTGFATFGMPFVLDLVTRAAGIGIKAGWRDKWLVHRRARPEEFGGHLHNHLTKKAEYPISNELLMSPVLARVFEKNGTYLLPMAYPDGCPIHPSYPAVHAVIAGASVTVLKALFEESYVFPNPVEASPDGLHLVPYKGKKLTVGGELNKLAGNIGIARNYTGIHWRSDCAAGLRQGEEVAIDFLGKQLSVQPERDAKLRFTKFDGQAIVI
jgi:hypothetical protein